MASSPMVHWRILRSGATLGANDGWHNDSAAEIIRPSRVLPWVVENRRFPYVRFLRDIISASLHTQDFTATRAQFIGKRLSWILRLLIVAIPLWWGIDALTLPAEYLPLLLRYRLLASGSLLLVATLLHFRRQWLMFCMTMSLLVLMLFHALCLLELSELDPLPVGFSLFPFVLMSLFAVLPLTLLASAASIYLLRSPVCWSWHWCHQPLWEGSWGPYYG